MKQRLLSIILLAFLGPGATAFLHPGPVAMAPSSQTAYPPLQTVMPPLPTYPPPPPQTPPAPTPLVPPETQRALEYIAAQEGIPLERLVVVNQHRRDYELLGRSFWVVMTLDAGSRQWYDVMVDLNDGSFVDNVESVEQAERAAYHARYGKLEPALFARLEAMGPDEAVSVAIWIAGEPVRSREELFAALAAKYPDARAALEQSGKPFAGDHDRINELEAEYVRMLEAETLAQVQPVIGFLQTQGYTVTTFGAMPAVAATLPKSLIMVMASRADVGAIYLSEDVAKTQLDSAVPTGHLSPFWNAGYIGSGITGAALLGALVLGALVAFRAAKLRFVAMLTMLGLLALLLVLIYRTANEDKALSFETIERTEYGQNYEEIIAPRLIIMAEADEITTFGDLFSADAQAQMPSLDLSKYLAIAVFQGAKPTTGYGAEIQRLERSGSMLTIYAHFTEPAPGMSVGPIYTSPYHLVTIQKDGLHGKFEFILNVDGSVISQQTYFLP